METKLWEAMRLAESKTGQFVFENRPQQNVIRLTFQDVGEKPKDWWMDYKQWDDFIRLVDKLRGYEEAPELRPDEILSEQDLINLRKQG